MDLRIHPVGRGFQGSGGMFAPAPFSFGVRPSLSGRRMGETEQSLYVRAKAAVAKYDDLINRLSQIADETYRAQVTERIHGDALDTSSPVHIRNSVYKSVEQAGEATPTDYLVFSNKPVQDDVQALEDLDRTFEEMVQAGESSYEKTSEKAAPPAPLSGPSLGMDTGSVVCASAGLVIVGTIIYFALK